MAAYHRTACVGGFQASRILRMATVASRSESEWQAGRSESHPGPLQRLRMAPRATVQIPDPVGLLLRGDLVCFLPEQVRLAQYEQRSFSIAGIEVWMPQQEV